MGSLHGSGISFARELFLKVTLDRTGAAQLETEHELRASLSMRRRWPSNSRLSP